MLDRLRRVDGPLLETLIAGAVLAAAILLLAWL